MIGRLERLENMASAMQSSIAKARVAIGEERTHMRRELELADECETGLRNELVELCQNVNDYLKGSLDGATMLRRFRPVAEKYGVMWLDTAPPLSAKAQAVETIQHEQEIHEPGACCYCDALRQLNMNNEAA